MTTNYQRQAQDFLDRFGIKFRATLSDSKIAPWSDSEHSLCGVRAEKSRHHYRVTLSSPMKWEHWGSRDARQINPNRRLTFDFWDSITNAEKGERPTAYDVLARVSPDTCCPDTFEEWCSEFGDSPDSIRALQTFRRCAAFAERLNQFFTAEEIEALGEIR